MYMAKKELSDLVSNRRAKYDYEILEVYEAGIALLGTEIKSVRNYGGSLQDAFVIIEKGEAWLKRASISPYAYGNVFNHEERRDRKLLLHRREIEKLKKISSQKGVAIIPLSMYCRRGFVKVKIAVCIGKKQYDKRLSIKAREQKRDVDRALMSQ